MKIRLDVTDSTAGRWDWLRMLMGRICMYMCNLLKTRIWPAGKGIIGMFLPLMTHVN